MEILRTDLYQLTMMAGYIEAGKASEPAVFEYFFRKMPNSTWGWCVFAGLQQCIDDLINMRFTLEDLGYLKSQGFSERVLNEFCEFKFSGSIAAVPEGTVVFPYEPIVTIAGTLLECQLVETMLLNRLNHATRVASHAARFRIAAGDKKLMEFGLRRAQGPDGGLTASRSAFIGGFDCTSNVEAGMKFGIPIGGTHAHSWVMAFPSEYDAFKAYARTHPENVCLLIDTYNTLKSGLPNAVKVLQEHRREYPKAKLGVRIDSGNLSDLSRRVRAGLDEAGLHEATIAVSGGLTEYIVEELSHEPIDSFGVGEQVVTGGESSLLSGVYKLCRIGKDNRSVMKISDDAKKCTLPGVKDLSRYYTPSGYAVCDILYDREQELAGMNWPFHDMWTCEPVITASADLKCRSLHQLVVFNGKQVIEKSIEDAQNHCNKEVGRLPLYLLDLHRTKSYPVYISPAIALKKQGLLMEHEEKALVECV